MLDEMCGGDFPRIEPPTDVVVLGHDCATWVIVRADGQVWATHPTMSTYVNATRQQFEKTCRAFEARWQLVNRRALSDDAVADRLREELRDLVVSVDPTVGDDFSWWLGVIE